MTTLLEKPICDRHCSICDGQDHHWMPQCTNDDGDPVEPHMACKHCDVIRPIGENEDFA